MKLGIYKKQHSEFFKSGVYEEAEIVPIDSVASQEIRPSLAKRRSVMQQAGIHQMHAKSKSLSIVE